jgi:hypothetical protein
MKVQFDHEFQSSLFLFLDNEILYKGQGSGASGGMLFNYYEETSDVPVGLGAFYSPQKQLVADGVPSGNNRVYIKDGKVSDGWYGQCADASKLLIVDHYDGRVILDTGYYGDTTTYPSMTISGDFAQKDFNVYITNESEEQLFVENEFILASDQQTYFESVTGLNLTRYLVPAVFISLNSTQNQPYGFGGEDDTKESPRLVCVADSNYGLDGILSMCRDVARKSFPIIPFAAFPYGEFFHIKETGYAYKSGLSPDAGLTGLADTYVTGSNAYIETATTSKLFDRSSNKIPKNLRIGFVDLDVANIRYPRQ